MPFGIICEVLGLFCAISSIYLLIKHNLIKLLDSTKLYKNVFYIIFFLIILILSISVALNGLTIESIYRDILESNYSESELLSYSLTILNIKKEIYKTSLAIIIFALTNFAIYRSIKKEIKIRNSKHTMWDLKKILNK